MSRLVARSLAVVALAFLFTGMAFAAEPPSADAFIATLEAPPAEVAPETPAPALGNVLEPVLAAIPNCPVGCCTYQCRKCTTTSVKLCAYNSCTGQSGCDPCRPGTVCAY